MEQIQQVYAAYQNLTERLNALQEAASEDPELKAKQEAFENTAKETMARQNPELSGAMDRIEVLVDELAANEEIKTNAPALSDSTQALVDEYQELKAKLEPLQREVMNDPAVAALRETLVEQTVSAMQGLDPQAESLIEQRQQLAQQLQSMQQAMMQQQMQQQMQQRLQQGAGPGLSAPGTAAPTPAAPTTQTPPPAASPVPAPAVPETGSGATKETVPTP